MCAWLLSSLIINVILTCFFIAYRFFATASAKQRNAMLQLSEQSDADIEAAVWEGFVRCCTQVPAQDNFYLSWYLRGSTGYDPLTKPDFCPPYLQEKSFEKLKVCLARCILLYALSIYKMINSAWKSAPKA